MGMCRVPAGLLTVLPFRLLFEVVPNRFGTIFPDLFDLSNPSSYHLSKHQKMDQQAVKFLIEQSASGDKVSFRKLVELHQKFAYATAFRLVCNNYEAEEVVQESFIRVWKHLAGFNTDMRFTTWLYKIVVNLCYDRMKSTRTKRKYMEDAGDNLRLMNISSTENIEGELINREQARMIRYFTESLTPRQKIVFVLSELEEKTVDEIKAITGLTPARIKSNLYCARREIRQKLSAMEERSESYAI